MSATDASPRPSSDLEALRSRLSGLSGRAYWRSLEELADSPEFERWAADELPAQGALWGDALGRRSFLQIMGASLALGGLGACTRQPREAILPYAARPEETVPGRPQHFATAMPFGGAALGLVVESHMGRPTKVEGNALHPTSLGATDALAQASLLDLYDPDRSQTPTRRGRISTWSEFLTELRPLLDRQQETGGAGLRILSRTVLSPTLAGQMDALADRFPRATWHQYEPVSRDEERRGAQRAFGRDVARRLHLERAEVVLSLDDDFLGAGPAAVVDARGFARARRGRRGTEALNRLYAVECTPTVTGAAADHRLALRAARVPALALELARALDAPQVAGSAGPRSGVDARWIDAVARDLSAHRGRCAVLAGRSQPAVVHALVHAINAALGNHGATVVLSEPVEPRPVDQRASLRRLVDDLRAGDVELLVVLDANPVYEAPAELELAAALDAAPTRVHLGPYADETAARCHWHVPATHYLEAWSDARGHDGTVSIVQPLIAPLYDGRSPHELVSALAGEPERSGYELVRAHWMEATGLEGDAFEAAWRAALHDGVMPGTELAALDPRLVDALDTADVGAADEGGLELHLRPDPCVWDGRFANNAWLQELPKPVTRLTWDNAALLAPATAERLGLEREQVVELRANGRSVRAPVWIVPGHAEDAVTLHLGYGRTHAGRVGDGCGVDAYALASVDSLGSVRGVELVPTGERARLACTQDHHSMEGRDIVRVETFDRFAQRGAEGHGSEGAHGEGGADGHGHVSFYDGADHANEDGHAWGMVIDLNACIGCNACVVACQAENNIPVVGKDQVAMGREMHWLRIDRYFEGDPADPATLNQPVPCMHCENAPCEVVCPVGATVHSSEGLNDMVYNRCVGTRYCANNCPYKVRRFNFYHYADDETEVLKLMRNPDVTVRTRGVMEKCTYCVQRISEARIAAQKEGRPVRDGEVRTACQQVCPTEAVAFGDLHDPASRVAGLRQEPHHYGLLEELNTVPRTTYLSKLTNPNPELAEG